MTNSKSTKRALLTSTMSILLCVSMLLGTTFAWFTDSVTSTNNIIKAGNLDVELYYQTVGQTGWTKVDKDTNVFKENALWEPGYTEVVKLKVVNEGSLALKYQLGVNVASETGSKNVAGEDFKLSSYIQYGIVDGGQDYTRETAVAAVDATANKLNKAYDSGVINLPAKTDGSNANEKVVTMVVYMPTTVGNEANYGKGQAVPTINLGINLAATQFTNEKDSFDEMYDASANVPDVTVFNAADLQAALDEAEAGKTTVIALADDITEEITITQKAGTKLIIDGNGNTVSAPITLDGKSATILTAGVDIQNVNFKADDISALGGADACIRLGDGTNATRYVCNATIRNCTFDIPGAVGVKSYTGGDKNLKIIGCTATEKAHSLAQLKGIDGVLVENCTVKSVRGINFNNSNNITVIDSTIDVEKYAVRFGESANSIVENYAITNCTLSSKNDDNDATIVLRAGATDANLTLTNTTYTGTIPMSGHENANIVIK